MSKELFIVCVLGYGLGCIQWSYILVRLIKKQDIRQSGFGNAGASNAFVSHGKRLGFAVAVLDGLKALLSIKLTFFLMKSGIVSQDHLLIFLNALFVILGHNFPFFMGFKGGKGTACLIGILFGLGSWYGLISICVILTFALFTNYIALGTVALLGYFLFLTQSKGYGLPSLIVAGLICLMSLYLHLPNFKRILAGTESKVRMSLLDRRKQKEDENTNLP